MARLGWIGLGRLGAQMAPRLVAAGHELVVYDRVATKTVDGAARAGGATEIAARSEAIFLCVTDTDAVARIAGEIASVDGAGKLLVDHSSIHPERTKEFASRLRAANGMGWVDAPVSGPVGSCAVFLGGGAEDVARVRPWIAAYAGTTTHMGPVGSGQLAKACSQAVICATVAAWWEALEMARRLGLDPQKLIEGCVGAGSDSAVRRAFAAQLLAGTLPPDSMRNLRKDLEILRDLAEAGDLPMPLNAVVRSRFTSGETR